MEEERYRITPKAWLGVRLDMDMHEFNGIWEEFTEFVINQAKENGMDEGVPCLVMEDGGVCITVVKG